MRQRNPFSSLEKVHTAATPTASEVTAKSTPKDIPMAPPLPPPPQQQQQQQSPPRETESPRSIAGTEPDLLEAASAKRFSRPRATSRGRNFGLKRNSVRLDGLISSDSSSQLATGDVAAVDSDEHHATAEEHWLRQTAHQTPRIDQTKRYARTKRSVQKHRD